MLDMNSVSARVRRFEAAQEAFEALTSGSAKSEVSDSLPTRSASRKRRLTTAVSSRRVAKVIRLLISAFPAERLAAPRR
jgi:hypothetical protein